MYYGCFFDADPEIGIESELFWEQGYKLKQNAEGQAVCPNFLRAHMEDILHCGKSLLLPRSQKDLDIRLFVF